MNKEHPVIINNNLNPFNGINANHKQMNNQQNMSIYKDY